MLFASYLIKIEAQESCAFIVNRSQKSLMSVILTFHVLLFTHILIIIVTFLMINMFVN
jgi:hypothetical protein